jgi:hypothetical protein
MTRLFLAAGVAALAIAMPASAKPGGGHGGGDQQAQPQGRAGGQGQARGGGGQRIERAPRFSQPRVERVPRVAAPRMERQQRFMAGPRQERARPQRTERVQPRVVERRSVRPNRVDRVQPRMVERQQVRSNRGEQIQSRVADRGPGRIDRTQRFQTRMANRQQLRGNRFEQAGNREAFRNDIRTNGLAQIQNREAFRDELRANRIERLDNGMFVRDRRFGARTLRPEDFGDRAVGYGVGGCPPGLASKGCMPPGQAAKLLGARFSDASRFMTFRDVPLSVRYLYPDTDDYYYRYGDGYLYRVDRSDALISALLPLAFGGYYPGSYLPSSYLSSPNYYMSGFEPSYYGFNSFYPDYGDDCYRYGYGVVYDVNCSTGFVDNAIPLYAGGYGVGQILPSGYGYYNVPSQYRSMYYDTPDYGYWYAPGAIYQYDPGNRMITSVAALLSPGFSIGQPLPMGYDVYNVPYAYRSTYYDTPEAWYRYNNGYIYQVDPVTQLVTAIVASILT